MCPITQAGIANIPQVMKMPVASFSCKNRWNILVIKLEKIIYDSRKLQETSYQLNSVNFPSRLMVAISGCMKEKITQQSLQTFTTFLLYTSLYPLQPSSSHYTYSEGNFDLWWA